MKGAFTPKPNVAMEIFMCSSSHHLMGDKFPSRTISLLTCCIYTCVDIILPFKILILIIIFHLIFQMRLIRAVVGVKFHCACVSELLILTCVQ